MISPMRWKNGPPLVERPLVQQGLADQFRVADNHGLDRPEPDLDQVAVLRQRPEESQGVTNQGDCMAEKRQRAGRDRDRISRLHLFWSLPRKYGGLAGSAQDSTRYRADS